ncbi:hypothetical protein P154DRAFT_430349 [Amniculicola lignicola CBS 123094]|uniref:Putative lipoate-protein ligase A n=1 Tax=Amniculicola lignicola CBS 123094 TaxID=1392246 RepID=A0A6A5WNM4_9PLEO|nr:hypothetical protein P154DRAFT_430349 [Amniculicola lignicola CBS 123094]
MAFTRRAISTFSEKLANPANRVQSYISRSSDPYLNLSIEDHILRTSPPESVVLFLYTNRPCVVIGRNQNPWYEVNLGILNTTTRGKVIQPTEPPGIGDVALVRRRSGGGAVFHDEGNVNWSITSPRGDFTRDKHAEMVVRALRKLGINRARVNERHDIVLDQGHKPNGRGTDPEDTHRTTYTLDGGGAPRPLKVSGSAYKLTRARALHHGTTLLGSPNLHIIPEYLHSPARPFMKAKGVESVSSPVGNIGLENEPFQQRLQQEFAAFYSGASKPDIVETVGEEHLDVPEIRKGYEEMRTADWMYSQTPQFELLLNRSDGRIEMTVHHGIIKSCELTHSRFSVEELGKMRAALLETKLQDIHDWAEFLRAHSPKELSPNTLAQRLAKYLPLPVPPKE